MISVIPVPLLQYIHGDEAYEVIGVSSSLLLHSFVSIHFTHTAIQFVECGAV